MKTPSNRVLLLTAIIGLVSLSACNKPGPAEEAGRQLDEEAEHASQALRQGANKVQDTLSLEQKHVNTATTDTDITAKVKLALMTRDGIKSLAISVKTHERVVTLSGSVSKASQSALAEKLALAVDGVIHVVNKLSVVNTPE